MFTKGQNWGFPPQHPDKMRMHHYDYTIAYLRNHLRYARMLRIDHVMGLHRLFWIPKGLTGDKGVYVEYPADETYAILSVESHRYQAGIVGENLGTVPPEVNVSMQRHNIQQMYVLQYEVVGTDPKRAVRSVPEDTVASLNTHDMSPFRAFLEGSDIDDRLDLKFLDKPGAKQERRDREAMTKSFRKFLEGKRLLKAGSRPSPQLVFKAAMEFLASSRRMSCSSTSRTCGARLSLRMFPQRSSNGRTGAGGRALVLKKSKHRKMRQKHCDSWKREGGSGEAECHYLTSRISISSMKAATDGSLKSSARITRVVNGTEGTNFAVWAPDAETFRVTGSFNGWNKSSHPLQLSRRFRNLGSVSSPRSRHGDAYKFHVVSRYHALPGRQGRSVCLSYRNSAAHRLDCLESRLRMARSAMDVQTRRHEHSLNAPMSIYEVHLGSWRRVPEDNNRSLSYREMAPHARRLHRSRWDSRMSNLCRSPSIRSTDRGDIRPRAISRRPAATARRRI